MNLANALVVFCFALSHLPDTDGKSSNQYTTYTLPQLCDSEQKGVKSFNESTFIKNKARLLQDLKQLQGTASENGDKTCATYIGNNQKLSKEFRRFLKQLRKINNPEHVLADIQERLCAYHLIWDKINTSLKQSIEDEPNKIAPVQGDKIKIQLLTLLCLLEKIGVHLDTCQVNKKRLHINKSNVCIKQDHAKKEMTKFVKVAVKVLQKAGKKKCCRVKRCKKNKNERMKCRKQRRRRGKNSRKSAARRKTPRNQRRKS